MSIEHYHFIAKFAFAIGVMLLVAGVIFFIFVCLGISFKSATTNEFKFNSIDTVTLPLVECLKLSFLIIGSGFFLIIFNFSARLVSEKMNQSIIEAKEAFSNM